MPTSIVNACRSVDVYTFKPVLITRCVQIYKCTCDQYLGEAGQQAPALQGLVPFITHCTDRGIGGEFNFSKPGTVFFSENKTTS